MKRDDTIEKGKTILRSKNIDFTMFKALMASYLHNTNRLGEDDFVMYYNDYAGCCGSTGFESFKDWVKEWFWEYNEDQHRIWLKNNLIHLSNGR